MKAADALFIFLDKMSFQKKIPADAAHPAVDMDFEVTESEMTGPEMENTKIHLLLLKLISALLTPGKKGKSDSTDSPVDIDDFLARLESWITETRSTLSPPSNLISLTPSSSAPSWLHLHTTHSTLETIKAITLFTSFASKFKSPSTKVSRENLNALNKLALSVVEQIKAQTQALKTQLSGSGMLGHLVSLVTTGPGPHEEKDGQEQIGPEGALAAQIEELVGMASLELFCGSLMESWDGALDGVLNVCGTLIV